jgi:hypothetical protein
MEDMSKGILERLNTLAQHIPERRMTPIWSNVQIEKIYRIFKENKNGENTELDSTLASTIVEYLDKNIQHADCKLIKCVKDNFKDPEFRANSEMTISMLFTCFAIQRLDIASLLLQHLYNYPRHLHLGVSSARRNRSIVEWVVGDNGNHSFYFDELCWHTDQMREIVLAFQWNFPLYEKYAAQYNNPPGHIFINMNDVSIVPGLSWCSSLPDHFLIPDCTFIPTKAYSHVKETFSKKSVKWEERRSVAFWRGATTGVPKVAGDWRTLERVKLCEIALSADPYNTIIDCGISSIKQFDDPQIHTQISEQVFYKGYVP